MKVTSLLATHGLLISGILSLVVSNAHARRLGQLAPMMNIIQLDDIDDPQLEDEGDMNGSDDDGNNDGGAVEGGESGAAVSFSNQNYQGCSASPQTNYQPLDESSLGDPYMFMHWTFNRGVSVITVGGELNLTTGNYELNSNAPPPVTWAVVNANNGFSTASLSLDVAASQQSQNAMGGPYLQYQSSINPNQDEFGEDTTTLLWLVPFDNTRSGKSTPYNNLDMYYFLLGSQSGAVYLYGMDTATGQVNGGERLASLGGDGIADMLYIPKMNMVLVMTFHGTIYMYNVNWSGLGPETNSNDGMSYNPIFLQVGQNSDLEDSSDDGDQHGYLPRTMTGIQYNEEIAYIYVCGLWGNGAKGNMAVFEFNVVTGLQTGSPLQLLTTIPTGACFQSLPTVYGMYFATNGNAVGFIPWGQPLGNSSTPAINGMLGENPEVFLVKNFGNNTVSSIAFSPNTNNVMEVKNPLSGQTKSYYTGGALFVAVVPSAILSDSAFYHDGGYIGPEALSDIYMHDPCTGETSLWINQLIQGPAYSMVADINMNLIVQNGNNGLTTLSVPFLPGVASLGTWILNNAYSCASSSNWLAVLGAYIAAAGFIFGGIVLGAAIAASSGIGVAAIGFALSTAGAATAIPPVV